ncbi:MAG TPA: YihY/virulence factor BrkB family protein [Vicinamibacterales bacterium]|nr:YihY/virulence factor BrkB family protein [Vicinamibacterales bacterium]
MLKAFRIPLTWGDLLKRTVADVQRHNCLGLAAQLSYYFFLALFPALLFLVALASFFPIAHLIDEITGALARVAPYEAMVLIQDQLVKISQDNNGGLLTIGMIGTIWSTSSGVTAIIDTLNQVYDIQEGRPWWKVRLMAIGLTFALAMFIIVSFGLVLVGPTLAEKVADWMHLGAVFTWAWLILQWPVVFALVALAVALVYYYAPDAEQDWIWITPGSLLATLLWVIISLGFKFYVSQFGAYNATYGTIGGIIVLLTWFYMSSLAILIGGELNAEIEHASPYGKEPGEKAAGEKKALGARAERAWQYRRAAGMLKPAIARANCDVDVELPPASPAAPQSPRATDWIISGVVLGEATLIACARLRRVFSRVHP